MLAPEGKIMHFSFLPCSMLRVASSLITKRAIHHSKHIPHIRTEPIKQVFAKPIRQSYARPVLFGSAISTSIFCTAALIHEREKETFWQQLKNRTDGPNWSKLKDIITDDKLVLKDLWNEKKKMWLEKKDAALEEMKKRLDQYNSIPIEIKRAFLTGAQTYLSMSDADKTMAGLILINFVVFGAWKIPTLHPWMMKYFTHNPSSGRSITLLTSCFSHKSLLHLTLNMVGLWSFGPLIHNVLGREQFVAMYLSIGTTANVCSHVLQLSLQSSRPIIPTLGASGALYGLLTGTALLYPNSSVFLVFLPMIPIRIA